MAKEIKLKELKTMVAKLNALKLGKKVLLKEVGLKPIKTGGKFEDVAEKFLDAFEVIAEEGNEKAAKKVPQALIAFQRRLFDQTEEPEEEEEEAAEDDNGEEEEEEAAEDDNGEEEEEEEEEEDEETPAQKKKRLIAEKKKKDAAKKKKKPAKKKSESKDRDEYGFVVDGKNNLFAKAISKKAMTMAQVKEADWNESSQSYYDCYKKLSDEGVADRTESKKMFIIGSKAEPKKGKKK